MVETACRASSSWKLSSVIPSFTMRMEDGSGRRPALRRTVFRVKTPNLSVGTAAPRAMTAFDFGSGYEHSAASAPSCQSSEHAMPSSFILRLMWYATWRSSARTCSAGMSISAISGMLPSSSTTESEIMSTISATSRESASA